MISAQTQQGRPISPTSPGDAVNIQRSCVRSCNRLTLPRNTRIIYPPKRYDCLPYHNTKRPRIPRQKGHRLIPNASVQDNHLLTSPSRRQSHARRLHSPWLLRKNDFNLQQALVAGPGSKRILYLPHRLRLIHTRYLRSSGLSVLYNMLHRRRHRSSRSVLPPLKRRQAVLDQIGSMVGQENQHLVYETEEIIEQEWIKEP